MELYSKEEIRGGGIAHGRHRAKSALNLNPFALKEPPGRKRKSIDTDSDFQVDKTDALTVVRPKEKKSKTMPLVQVHLDVQVKENDEAVAPSVVNPKEKKARTTPIVLIRPSQPLPQPNSYPSPLATPHITPTKTTAISSWPQEREQPHFESFHVLINPLLEHINHQVIAQRQLQQNLDGFQSQTVQMEDEINTYRRKNRKLEKRVDELEHREDMDEKLAGCKAELQDQKAENQRMQRSIARMRRENADTVAGLEVMVVQRESLIQALKERKLDNEWTINNFSNALEAAQQELRDRDLMEVRLKTEEDIKQEEVEQGEGSKRESKDGD